jgi:hypothetical protein
LPDDVDETLDCDDGTDCPFGETCCFSFASALSARVCTKRRGPENDCRVEVCAEGGARCPKGQVCDHSVCRSPSAAATCRQASVLGPSPNKKNWRCPAEHPICSSSPANTQCMSLDEHEAKLASGEERTSLLCTVPNDCGPESRCCTNGVWTGTQCLTNCDASNNGEICASDADCTSLGGKPAKGKCGPADVKTLPPWLKVCIFE